MHWSHYSWVLFFFLHFFNNKSLYILNKYYNFVKFSDGFEVGLIQKPYKMSSMTCKDVESMLKYVINVKNKMKYVNILRQLCVIKFVTFSADVYYVHLFWLQACFFLLLFVEFHHIDRTSFKFFTSTNHQLIQIKLSFGLVTLDLLQMFYLL